VRGAADAWVYLDQVNHMQVALFLYGGAMTMPCLAGRIMFCLMAVGALLTEPQSFLGCLTFAFSWRNLSVWSCL
jgi:hypothetical protein